MWISKTKNLKLNKILLTGSTGFLGTYIKKNFIFKKKLIFNDSEDFTSVIHLAAINKFPEYNLNKSRSSKINYDLFKNTIKKKNLIDTYIFASTIDCGKKNYPKFKKEYVDCKKKIENELYKLYKLKFIKKVYILRLPFISRFDKSNFLVNIIEKLNSKNNLTISKTSLNYNSITSREDINKFINCVFFKKKKTFLKLNFCSNKTCNLEKVIKIIKKKSKNYSKLVFKDKSYNKGISSIKLMKFPFVHNKPEKIILNLSKKKF